MIRKKLLHSPFEMSYFLIQRRTNPKQVVTGIVTLNQWKWGRNWNFGRSNDSIPQVLQKFVIIRWIYLIEFNTIKYWFWKIQISEIILNTWTDLASPGELSSQGMQQLRRFNIGKQLLVQYRSIVTKPIIIKNKKVVSNLKIHKKVDVRCGKK